MRFPYLLKAIMNLPWFVKRWLESCPFRWRLLSGLCRRIGWNDQQKGWYVASNGPYSGIRLQAKSVNHLWVPMGLYEPWVSYWLVRLLTETQWGCRKGEVWDIGAHFGYSSLLCSKYGARHVTAFEPVKKNRKNFQAHLNENPNLAGRIEIIHTALSDTDGESEFMVRQAGSMSQLINRSVELWDTPLQKVETAKVRTAKIDSLIKEGRTAPDLIKIDVEGAEALVLEGGKKLLNEHHPVILLEAHHEQAGSISNSILKEAGYKIFLIQKNRLSKCQKIPFLCHFLAIKDLKK